MKLKLKIHGPKLHSPSWHHNGEKYKLGKNWLRHQFKLDEKGHLKVGVRSGFRERGRHKADSSPVFVPRRIGEMMRPENSAASRVVSGNFLNPLRSKF